MQKKKIMDIKTLVKLMFVVQKKLNIDLLLLS